MARSLRLHLPNSLYHVMSRGNNKQCIFTDDEDHRRFVELLARTLCRFKVICIGYCLVWNHYHLLVSPGELPISRMMQHLNSTYCQWFNRRSRRVGAVLQGRYKSLHVDTDAYMLTALRYVVLNAVEAGLTDRPESWRWGSYAATAGLAPVPDFLAVDRIWEAFGTADPVVGRHRFTVFIAAASPQQLDLDKASLVLGSEAFAERITPLLAPHQDVRDFPYAHRFATRPRLATLFDGRSTREERQDASYDAFAQAYTLREIARLVDRAPSTVWTWIKAAEARRLQNG